MDTLPFPASGGFGVGSFILCAESKGFFLLWNNINFVNGIYTGHYCTWTYDGADNRKFRLVHWSYSWLFSGCSWRNYGQR